MVISARQPFYLPGKLTARQNFTALQPYSILSMLMQFSTHAWHSQAGADIVKIAAMANDISDAARMLDLLKARDGGCRLQPSSDTAPTLGPRVQSQRR